MKLLSFLVFMFIATTAQAQCVGEILSVTQDARFGNIVVETKYVLNGVDVQTGKTRYDENSGTADEVKQKIQSDIEIHCASLISRIVENRDFLDEVKLQTNKAATASLLNELKSEVGVKSKIVDTYKQVHKGKIIELKSDKSVSVTDAP